MARWDWDKEPEDVGSASYIFDKEMDCLVKIREGSNTPKPQVLRPMDGVIRDIQPYVALGIADHRTGNMAPLVITGGRRQHRDELRARNLIEVGNEKQPMPKLPGDYLPSPKPEIVRAFKQALGKL